VKTVDAALKTDQTHPYQTYWKEVQIYRRWWDSLSKTYKLEKPGGTYPVINEALIKISNIAWKLDSTSLNEWKVSNVTLEVDNRENFWDRTDSDGFFYNYEPLGSEIRIKAGNVLSDGTKKLIYVFRGVIDRDITFSPDKKRAHIYVAGYGQKLDIANAENVSTAITGEDMGTGNGVLKDFDTANNGVGRFDEIRIDAVVKKRGLDYDISQLNDKDNPGRGWCRRLG